MQKNPLTRSYNVLDLSVGGVTLLLSSRTHIMGVLNVTPDSFSDGGRFILPGGLPDYSLAIESALKMAEDGADIIDVGGESTRPGSDRISLDEELRRVIPVIEGIRRHSKVVISIDTYKSGTALEAVRAGACIVNDISGGLMDPEIVKAAADTGAAFIIMHMQGTPADMQAGPRYDNVVPEVCAYLDGRARHAASLGIPEDKILVDPGIGFGKTISHNLALIGGISGIALLGYPVVLGVSRKAFIGKLTGAPEKERLEGTIAASVLGIAGGANILRVHDVLAAKRAAIVADAVLGRGARCDV